MGGMGSVGPGGGAPMPDAERVAAIRFTILDDPETCAAFGEAPRALLADTKGPDAGAELTACQTLLVQLKDRLTALDPTALIPRKGLAGLFDSRTRRLKTFRAAYAAAAAPIGEIMERLSGQGRAIETRSAEIEGRLTGTRQAIVDLDAHIAAARAWLADRIDTTGTVTAPSEGTATAMEPHPLVDRLAVLTAARKAAIARLPASRAAQNAEHRLAAALKDVTEAIAVWREDWQHALGLTGNRPRKNRPDIARLTTSRATLEVVVAKAQRELGLAETRLAELATRRSIRPLS